MAGRDRGSFRPGPVLGTEERLLQRLNWRRWIENDDALCPMLPRGHCEDSIEAYELRIGNFSGGLMLGDMPKGRPQTWLAFMGIAALGVIGLSAIALLSF